MRSTFMGLEASKRGIFTQQSGLYTVGHNISNAKTEGYTRQRVNMEATRGFPTAGLQTPKTVGHIGTGVQAGSIQRIRDEFTDRQYRQETNRLGYWDTRAKEIEQIEAIMHEPSDFGLNEAFKLFWQSMQDVADKPTDLSARTVAIERAKHLADSFNYMDKQIRQVQSNAGQQTEVVTDEANSLLAQIANLNHQIMKVEPNGYVPNDLYDARDVLVDRLNEIIPVTTERVPSGGNANEVAEGSLTVYFKDANGDKTELVNGKDAGSISLNGAGKPIDGQRSPVLFDTMTITKPNGENVGFEQGDFEPNKGELLSLINAFGYDGPGGELGLMPELLDKLDTMAETFIKEFNAVLLQGYTLQAKEFDGTIIPSEQGSEELFTGESASDIGINDNFFKEPHLLTASGKIGEEGDNSNALKMANMQHKGYAQLDNGTIESFYQGVTGRLGVDGQEAIRSAKDSAILQLSIANRRASVSSVSLDEEMTNMITFQQAYNANARMITVVDETLDKIINGMGRVGL
ncbi:flagellar hook-associated protein FlgK [Metalysinibacillus jejuensis]|uniref:flagellar hook-associated protein FlgK n=1 Tax=Metalysinibacillus jejuensis TaxID=914327 RepID=UPI000D38612F|nr:flagellar hook-associated protein FlgK [Metalysinibacillus jejuensis]